MSLFCPADGTACPDDMCRSCGCAKLDGAEMLERCPICHELLDPDCNECQCDELYEGGEYEVIL